MARHLRPIQRSTEPNLAEKIAMGALYLVFGGIVAVQIDQASNLIMLFMLLAFLYWLLIGRNPRKTKYFVRYHLVQSILLNTVLATGLWLLMETFYLVQLLIPPSAIIIKLLVEPFPNILLNFSVLQILVFGINLVLAGYCLMGQETELPYVSDGVRYWVRW